MTARQNDGSLDVWVRQYLNALLNDPALRLPAGLLPLWLDQQVDPAAERGRDNLARLHIQHVAERSPRSVVLGPAGSGKTLLVRQIVRQFAEQALENPQAVLPLYIPLTFFAGSIEGTLGAQARMRGPAVASLALQRPCILIVDALNDVAPTEQLEVLGMLRRAMTQLGPQGRWLIMCRSEQWALFHPWLQSSRTAVWRIRPWNDQTVQSALSKVEDRGTKLLAGFPGAVELARRPRWLGSLMALAAEKKSRAPGRVGLAWVLRAFSEAARSHCLSESSVRHGLDLLAAIADALRAQPQHTLSRAAVIAIVNSVADDARVSSDELLVLVDATGILDLQGDDEWSLRSTLLSSLAAALDLQAAGPEQWRAAAAAKDGALPLLYGLLDKHVELISALIDAAAWEDVQRVLDANEEPSEALAALEATQRVDIDNGAALGRVWARHGSPDVAIMLLRWAIKQGRDDPQLYGLLGDIYMAQAQWSAARDSYSDALARDASNLHYQQSLARACHELGEDDVAARTLEQAMSTHHRQLAQTAFHLGGVYEQRGRYTEALSQYLTAVSLVPADTRFSLSQARVLRLLERFEEARSLLRSLQTQPIEPGPLAAEWAALMLAQGNDEQALVHLEHQVELGVAGADVYLEIGRIHRRQNRPSEAIGAFSTAIDLDPRCRAAYEELAGQAIDLKDLGTAAAAYRRLAELTPDDAAVQRKLGTLLRELDQLSEAAVALRASLEAERSAETFLQLARVRWAQGEQADALRLYRSALELSPSDGAIAAETGWALIESGDRAGALEPLHAAALLLPENGRVLYDLGRAYELQGNRSEALEWYERASTVAPRSIEALRATGRMAAEAGFGEMARNYFARALRIERRNAEANADVGRLHLQARNGARAEAAFRRALAGGSSDPQLRRDLAEALLLTGKAADALRWLEQVEDEDAAVQSLRSKAYEQLGDPRMALVIARSAAAQRPRDAKMQRRLGSLALKAGNISEALKSLELAITLGDIDAATQLDYSRALLAAGKHDAALSAAAKAVERAPHVAANYEQLGLSLLAANRCDDARRSFEQAIELDPASAGAWSGLAEVFLQQYGPGSAVSYARHALDLDGADERYRLQLARLLVMAGEYAEAQSLLEKLREPRLDAERLLIAIAVATRQWPLAVAAAERALSIAPNDAHLLAEYGRALVETGRYADAVAPLTKACARSDAAAEWWAWQGRAFAALEQWPTAIAAYEQSLQSVQQPELYEQLAEAYARHEQPAMAAQALQAAIERGGDTADRRAKLAEAYEQLGWQPEALREWQLARDMQPRTARFGREVGRLHLLLGNAEQALSELEAATAQDSEDRQGWELFARAALAAGDADRAVHAAASALAMAPEAHEPRQILGEALLRRGDSARALQCLAPLLELPAVDPRTYLLVNEAAQASGNLALARRALESAFRAAPEDVNVQLRLAAHFRNADPPRALKILRSLTHRHPKRADLAATLAEFALDQNDLVLARIEAERAIELAPDTLAYQRIYGHVSYRLGEYDIAKSTLQHVLSNRPQDGATALALGSLALDRGEVAEAARLLQIAAQARPDDPDANGMLGLALRHRWQPVWEDEPYEPQHDPMLDEAIASLERAAAKSLRWRGELGWSRLITGQVTEAVRELADAVRELDPMSKDRGVALRRLAIALMQAGQLDEAATVAAHAGTLLPSDPIVAAIQGQLAERRGDLPEAVRLYARAVALEPQAGRHHRRLGGALLESGEIEPALDHLRRATDLEPAGATGWMLLGRALLKLEMFPEALSAAQRATQLNGRDAASWRQMADALEALGQPEAALDAFERATQLQPSTAWYVDYADMALRDRREERARAVLIKAVHYDPDSGVLAYKLARLSDGPERAAHLERAVTIEPRNAAWRTELARTMLARGQQRGAIMHLEQAVELEPHVAEHWTVYAQALLAGGDDFTAENTLRRGLTFLPNGSELWLSLGDLLAGRTQWQEAFDSYKRALDGDPEPKAAARSWAGQGRCLIWLDRPEHARSTINRAIELDPDNAEALSDLAHIQLAQKRWKEAIRDARRAIERDPSIVDAYRTLAEAALLLKGDWINDAHDAIERALAVQPDDPRLRWLKGKAYYAEGEYEMALDEFRAAIEGAPDEADFMLWEAYALRRLRRFDEAVQTLNKAVRLRKHFKEALSELMALTTEMFIHRDRN